MKGAVLFAALLAVGALLLRLAAGPVSVQSYADEVGRTLAGRIGPGWTVSLVDTRLELHGIHPALRTDGLLIDNPQGVTVVRAPSALVSLDTVALLSGRIAPRELELQGLQVIGRVAPDGSLSFAAGTDSALSSSDAPPANGEARPSPGETLPAGTTNSRPSVVAAALASLLKPVLGAEGVVNALDRASVRDASLTLVGADGRERAAFRRVAAVFERPDEGSRRIRVDLEGPNGAWSIAGTITGVTDPEAQIEAENVPLDDVLLLTGLSHLPGRSDLRLGGRAAVAFRGGVMTRLDGHFESGQGVVQRPGGPPIRLDGAVVEASWNEALRRLDLPTISARSEGTSVRLSADLSGGDGQPWRLRIANGETVVAGLRPEDGSFRIDDLQAGLRFDAAGVVLEGAKLKGDKLDLEMAGSIATGGAAGLSGQGTLTARNTAVRRLVRLWPDGANPPLRDFLAQRVDGGTVERLDLRSVLDPADFRAAFSDTPLTDGALDLRFSTRGVTVRPADGLPPIRNLAVDGVVSGTRASVSARDGSLDLPDGRHLDVTDVSYLQPTLDKPNTPAQIGFRLAGGADALGSLLRQPALGEGVIGDVDLGTVSGRVDVRARMALRSGKLPPLSELGLSLNGTVNDLTVDRLPGKEKLEGGRFTLTGENGALSIKGEGKLSGTPASFDYASPHPGAGELTVAAVLDDGGRTRRNLPGPPALAGPVAIRAVVPVGPGRPGARLEADLARASVDGLVPGWVKPAGKPGKLVFTLASEGETTELRDLTLEAAPASIRGTVTLSGSGGLERADLPVFRLSPSDDLRAQVDRSPSGAMRVLLKGNNADARPFLRWIGAKDGRPAGNGRDGGRDEVEVDIGLNIMTGFNDEAMTSVAGKITAKGGELRTAQFGGRFRAAGLEAQLAKRDAGAPILALRSGDAGTTLRFFDLYRRMVGGTLALDGRIGDGSQSGRVTIEDFGLRNEPALSRLVTQAQAQPGGEDKVAPIASSESDQVLFRRLTADLRRTGSRTDYSDVTIYGPQVGFTLNGYVDTARDRLDITGTFVPAYALNSALNQVPVVGLFLGGQNEGLFAVDFRVMGPIASPALTVNPLTAVAPGILRKLFGWMLHGEPAGEAATAAPVPTAAPTRRSR